MNGDVLIKVEGIRKKFCRSLKKSLWYGLKDIASEVAGGGKSHDQLRPGEFWAIDDVSFQLRRGECLGLIGHNGAGKTTLLKMLNGLIKPDHGRVEMRGRTGALIALGAGFNPILTGRENIYVNGSVLGLSKRLIDERLNDILDFAEIGEAIDAPVQSYSSGMNVRLGFAIAVILIEPDILFLDEVLAVGDINFTIKCLNAVRRLSENAAVIFVSHSMQFVSAFCTRVIVMERGRVLLDAANPAEGIDRYYAMLSLEKQISGTKEAEVLGLTLRVDGVEICEGEPQIAQGTEATALLRLRVDGPREGAHLFLCILDEAMSPAIFYPVEDESGNALCIEPGVSQISVPLGNLELNAGKYSMIIGIRDARTALMLCRVQGVFPFRIFASKSHWSKVVRTSRAQILKSSSL